MSRGENTTVQATGMFIFITSDPFLLHLFHISYGDCSLYKIKPVARFTFQDQFAAPRFPCHSYRF